MTQQEFDNSLTVTKPLILSILEDVNLNIEIIREDQHKARQTVHQSNKEAEIARAEAIVKSIPSTQQRAVSLAQERGSSSWLTTLPIEEHGFALHKGAFRDALALRYGWRPSNMAMTCVCGKSNDVQHALSCRVGGLPIHRHNDIRDLSASLISEVCTNTEIEPTLQPLTGERLDRRSANAQDEARLDIRCRGFWQSGEDAFFDIRVFNPFAASNQNRANTPLTSIYRKHEQEKRRSYDQRVREVEHGSFVPLVFSATGGMGPSTTVAYKRLASLLSQKRDHPYAETMRWLRCRLCFGLLKAAIVAIRGSRSSARSNYTPDSIALAVAEGNVSH